MKFPAMALLAALMMQGAAFSAEHGHDTDHSPQKPGHHQTPLKIKISVVNTATQAPIAKGAKFDASTPFQVTVTTNGVDCAGQFVVTALGDTSAGAPPAFVVQSMPFVIGAASGSNTVTGTPVSSTVTPDNSNDVKISATCNGAEPSQYSSAFEEFFVQLN